LPQTGHAPQKPNILVCCRKISAFCVCECFATEYGGFSAGSPTGGRHGSAALKEDEQEQ